MYKKNRSFKIIFINKKYLIVIFFNIDYNEILLVILFLN